MIQLEPGEYFGIVREIADPNDTGTYYVQAVIRDARTDALISTVNLTDRGSNRFSKEFQVPSVGIGVGRYISITTYVYTDADYTTYSDAYSRESDTYLISPRAAHLGGGGGPGADFYRGIFRKLMQEFLALFLAGIPKLDIEPLAQAIRDAQKAQGTPLSLDDIESVILKHKINVPAFDDSRIIQAIADKVIPEHIPTDLQPVLDAIEAKPVTEVPAMDHTPVLEAIKSTNQEAYVQALVKSMQGLMERALPGMLEALTKVKDAPNAQEEGPEENPIWKKPVADLIREMHS